MTNALFAQKKEKLQKDCPKMFEHPELRAGEVWYGNEMVETVFHSINMYRSIGIPSARKGNQILKDHPSGDKQLPYHPVFVDLREFLEAEEKHGQRELS